MRLKHQLQYALFTGHIKGQDEEMSKGGLTLDVKALVSAVLTF